ncbi:Protein CBG26550 [Caenorhabditis briggsae]|uniref:Protein CBG26550 n=1 Tax=Caenorhabditis briggsae TaxID=6238 RepID=B6IK49_CAEBR|nr:Protein CBG26550 [Caenorhabditis briggsae]CAS00279.1 Protein CBG26550 [Caenorhabditis briggsae]
MVPCQNKCCITEIKFLRNSGRYQFLLHTFIQTENQFDAFWDCNICGSFQRNRNHYRDHQRGITRLL